MTKYIKLVGCTDVYKHLNGKIFEVADENLEHILINGEIKPVNIQRCEPIPLFIALCRLALKRRKK